MTRITYVPWHMSELVRSVPAFCTTTCRVLMGSSCLIILYWVVRILKGPFHYVSCSEMSAQAFQECINAFTSTRLPPTSVSTVSVSMVSLTCDMTSLAKEKEKETYGTKTLRRYSNLCKALHYSRFQIWKVMRIMFFFFFSSKHCKMWISFLGLTCTSTSSYHKRNPNLKG